MTHEPVAGADGGYVVCVGLTLSQVSEIARLLRGHGVVLATADTEGARALLGPPAPRAAGAPGPRAVSVVPADPVPVPTGPDVAPPLTVSPQGAAEGRSRAGAWNAAATLAIPVVRAPGPRGHRPAPTQAAHTAAGTAAGAAAGAGETGAAAGAIAAAGSAGTVRRVPSIRRGVPNLSLRPRFSTGAGRVPMVHNLVERPAPLVRGPLVLDPATREVTAYGRRIHLSVREFDLLAVLASRVDRVWSFAELTATVWNSEYLGDPDHVTSAVKRLRKRLTTVRDLEVASVRGVGYRLMVAA
ncbi:winged helix-turn-helix domain-containing protein [Antribacter gilvus]|uniref:winged helix-turn-helix domain-containing protein n=1 Tax=Antribacter gilvus TaxID=2304675 RepID=UPI000F770EB0|nr:winged helix-turn-helix domain-containing protein [Antribacter gilvus]